MLDALSIQSRKFDGPGKHTRDGGSFITPFIDEYPYTFSTEVSLPKPLVDEYRDAMQQSNWYGGAIKDSRVTDADRAKLLKDRTTLWGWLDKTFGNVEAFQANQKLWTPDGYRLITDATRLGEAFLKASLLNGVGFRVVPTVVSPGGIWVR